MVNFLHRNALPTDQSLGAGPAATCSIFWPNGNGASQGLSALPQSKDYSILTIYSSDFNYIRAFYMLNSRAIAPYFLSSLLGLVVLCPLVKLSYERMAPAWAEQVYSEQAFTAEEEAQSEAINSRIKI
ncbi:hypothetical protein BH24BAC1_BH24BAC1_30750 [soil metagenome]